MAALPFRFTGEESLLADGKVVPGPNGVVVVVAPEGSGRTASGRHRRRELSARALGVGLAIGAFLAAGNVYTSLKSGFIDGGALTAALLSFTFFVTFKRLARVPFGPFENNVAQTAASSAAIMTYVHGLMGPMPALTMMGHHISPWVLWLWGLMVALIGMVIGVTLRRKLVVEEALPFPTGTATAELIRTVHADRASAARRTRFLVVAALGAAVLTWFRDGRPAVIPQALYLPFTVAGLAAAALTLGLAASPLMAATGMFIGIRGAFSLLGGGLVAWGILGPIAVHGGWAKEASYGPLNGWLIWPALGMMLGSALTPLVLDARVLGRALLNTARDVRNAARRRGPAAAGVPGQPSVPGPPQQQVSPAGHHNRLGTVAAVAAVVIGGGVLAALGSRVFGFHPALTVGALALSVVLAAICARAAGETDIAPVGSFGTLTQLLFAGAGSKGSVLAGAIVAGNASETAQAMWAFKAGHSLRASIRAQVVAQVLGALVGSLVVVPTYLLVVKAYPPGSERMPAVVAVSWKATAEALSGNLGGLPPHALFSAVIAFVLGVGICVAQRLRPTALLPSAVALGIGMITPVSLSAAAVVGAGAMLLCRRRFSGLGDGESNAVAAGLLAGESIMGVGIAALTAIGLL